MLTRAHSPRPVFRLLSRFAWLALLASPAIAQQAQRVGQAPDDEDATRLRERAERPVDAAPAAAASAERAIGAGNLLFSMVGADNAACVRSIADVNGDGLDEVLVGIDESGTDNVFCLDGASSGAATVVWSLETSAGVSGGSPYGDQCLEVASDGDGNGKLNVLLGTAWGGRTAYELDGLAGATRWKFDTYLEPDSGWIYSLAEMSDVTGDGVTEVVFGTGSMLDRIYMVDGDSDGQATVLWSYAAPDATYSVRNLGDVNEDGDDDVLAAIGDNGDRLVCLDGGTSNPAGSVVWSYTPGTSVFACGVLPDVTGDGIDEAIAVLWTLDGSAIRCLNGATGGLVWSSTDVAEYGQMVDVLADVTGDGIDELIVSSWENAVQVLDGSDGTRVWKTTVGTTNGGDVWTARATPDLNGDGHEDVVAGSFDYHVYALDGDTGDVFWAYDTQNRVFSVHPVGDLNGDGRPEVVAGTQDTNNLTVAYVLEGDAGIAFPGLTQRTAGVIGASIQLEVTGPVGHIAWPAVSKNTASVTVPPFEGVLGLGNPLRFLPVGVIGPGAPYIWNGNIPPDPMLVGRTFHTQALVYDPGPPQVGSFTNIETLTIGEG